MSSDLADIDSVAGEPKAKRSKLRPYDLLPGQLLNPMGASGVDKIELEKLAKVQGTGNKAAPALYKDS